ncbi:DUF2147 domain-containing protein [Pedobacter sp. L105]|uniref:DUF2147 domain-containing protein n=1 Tax=Pedobacter sp. L105 TaxID=1641871 RepID=UPI00131B16AC|nr:DUF2147 domain-containing protein [Pedobacter sp. L105]
MKAITKITAVLLLTLMVVTKGLLAQSTSPDALIGAFQTKDGTGIIQVYKQGNQYFGKVTQGTKKTPVGTIVLREFTYSSGKWTGKIYVPAKDKVLNCTITLSGANTMNLAVKAGLMGKDLVWTRVK